LHRGALAPSGQRLGGRQLPGFQSRQPAQALPGAVRVGAIGGGVGETRGFGVEPAETLLSFELCFSIG